MFFSLFGLCRRVLSEFNKKDQRLFWNKGPPRGFSECVIHVVEFGVVCWTTHQLKCIPDCCILIWDKGNDKRNYVLDLLKTMPPDVNFLGDLSSDDVSLFRGVNYVLFG